MATPQNGITPLPRLSWTRTSDVEHAQGEGNRAVCGAPLDEVSDCCDFEPDGLLACASCRSVINHEALHRLTYHYQGGR